MADQQVAQGPGAHRRRTIVFLVRHGETEGNVQRVWHGSMDAPLTPRGEMQVAATARRVVELARRYPIQAFYVSPLPRAQSTAAAIARALGQDPEVEADLREFDLGAWEGRSFQELREVEDLWGRWAQDPDFAPPQGESPRSFNRRATAVVERLAKRHPGQVILVVTHGGIICNALANWIGDGPEDWRRWDPHNCAITMLVRDGDIWKAVFVNDIGHLPPEAIDDEFTINGDEFR